MNRVTVQYCVNGRYGEMTAKSAEMTHQQMVDEMHKTGNPGISFRFIGDGGILVPTGYTGDNRGYILSAQSLAESERIHAENLARIEKQRAEVLG